MSGAKSTVKKVSLQDLVKSFLKAVDYNEASLEEAVSSQSVLFQFRPYARRESFEIELIWRFDESTLAFSKHLHKDETKRDVWLKSLEKECKETGQLIWYCVRKQSASAFDHLFAKKAAWKCIPEKDRKALETQMKVLLEQSVLNLIQQNLKILDLLVKCVKVKENSWLEARERFLCRPIPPFTREMCGEAEKCIGKLDECLALKKQLVSQEQTDLIKNAFI